MASVLTKLNEDLSDLSGIITGVPAVTATTLKKAVGDKVYAGLRDEEKKFLISEFASNPASALRYLGIKAHVPVEGGESFHKHSVNAGFTKQKEQYSRSVYNIHDFLTREGALRALRSGNAPRDHVVAMAASAAEQLRLAEIATPYWPRFEAYQKIGGKIFDAKPSKPDPTGKALRDVGVNVDDFINVICNVLLTPEERIKGTRIEGFVRKVDLPDATKPTLRNVVLATRQADSALVANAVLERLTESNPDNWAFTEGTVSEAALSVIERPGERKADVFTRVAAYAEEIKSVLPERESLTPEGQRAYDTVASQMVTGCIQEGVFGLHSPEERFAALAKVTCDPSISSTIARNPELLPEDMRDIGVATDPETGVAASVNQTFLFDHNNNVVSINPMWWAHDTAPAWLAGGKTIPQEGRTAIDAIEGKITQLYGVLPEEYKHIVPDDLSFADLSNKDLKIGNGLTALIFSKHAQLKEARLKKEFTEQQDAQSLPNLCPNGKHYGLYNDLNYYKICMQEAARNFAKYGLPIKSNLPVPPADPTKNPIVTPDPVEGGVSIEDLDKRITKLEQAISYLGKGISEETVRELITKALEPYAASYPELQGTVKSLTEKLDGAATKEDLKAVTDQIATMNETLKAIPKMQKAINKLEKNDRQLFTMLTGQPKQLTAEQLEQFKGILEKIDGIEKELDGKADKTELDKKADKSDLYSKANAYTVGNLSRRVGILEGKGDENKGQESSEVEMLKKFLACVESDNKQGAVNLTLNVNVNGANAVASTAEGDQQINAGATGAVADGSKTETTDKEVDKLMAEALKNANAGTPEQTDDGQGGQS